MSPVTKWSFCGTDFELNPFQDTGWLKELKTAEVQLIDSDVTVIQTSGFISRGRRIRGWISTSAGFNQLKNWLGAEGTLIDDLGVSKNCMLVSFTPERVFDIKNWRRRRYTAIFRVR